MNGGDTSTRSRYARLFEQNTRLRASLETQSNVGRLIDTQISIKIHIVLEAEQQSNFKPSRLILSIIHLKRRDSNWRAQFK